ncbi:MAG TPA: hypothetical protein VE466_13335, partial [Acidimicrobiales bacterium]|nr:hypothetical protein [Acidimicrobiales bacterium]
ATQRRPGQERRRDPGHREHHCRGDPPERSRDSPGGPERQPSAPEPDRDGCSDRQAALSATITHRVATTVALRSRPQRSMSPPIVSSKAVPARSPVGAHAALANPKSAATIAASAAFARRG